MPRIGALVRVIHRHSNSYNKVGKVESYGVRDDGPLVNIRIGDKLVGLRPESVELV